MRQWRTDLLGRGTVPGSGFWRQTCVALQNMVRGAEYALHPTWGVRGSKTLRSAQTGVSLVETSVPVIRSSRGSQRFLHIDSVIRPH